MPALLNAFLRRRKEVTTLELGASRKAFLLLVLVSSIRCLAINKNSLIN